MKFIRTREHEQASKKEHTQPTIPVEIGKHLLVASNKQSEQHLEEENKYAVDQVEQAAAQLAEQTAQTASMIPQVIHPIIDKKVIQAGIKDQATTAEPNHPLQDNPSMSVPAESQHEIVGNYTITVHEPILQNTHYGPGKAPKQKQNSLSAVALPKEKSKGGASTPKAKPSTPIASTPPPSGNTQSRTFFRHSAVSRSFTLKQTNQAVTQTGKSRISSLASIVGGSVLLIALCTILLLAAVFSSPIGILFSDQSEQSDTVLLNVAIAQINNEYTQELEELQEGDYDGIVLHGTPPDWREVVAVFASKSAGGDQGVDVMTLDPDRVDRLRTVFWDMTKLSSKKKGKVLHVFIDAKTAENMRLVYLFSQYQNEALDLLLDESDSITTVLCDLSITQKEAVTLWNNLPDDLDPMRKAVVQHALSLVGKVNYFWGGKSLVLGWDSQWGSTVQVTAEGSSTTGTYRPFGLDCSGFVDWTFFNATDGKYLVGDGGGTIAQHEKSKEISWSEALPGDLVFYADDSHVGIVGGSDDHGNMLIIHCSVSPNNVVITGADDFSIIASPFCYSE